MAFNLSNINWKWIVIGVILAFIIAYGASVCVVTGYATILAFQAMGTPDQVMINEFAASYAGGVTAVFIGIGTLAGGMLAGRKAAEDAIQNGLMVGLITALIDLVLSVIGGLSLWTIVSLAFAVGGGWLGGKLTSKSNE